MKKTNLANVLTNVKTSVHKHTPEILIGCGIAGMVTSTILAVKATPKAIKLIEKKKEETGQEKLSVVDTVKTTWKCYVPSVIVVAASAGCLIGSASINFRRNAALATAYKISETAYKEYRDKVVETIGEKKDELIRDKIAKEKIEKNPPKKEEIILTEHGSTLCYDSLSGRYFRSDINKIKKAENDLNRRMLGEHYVSLNDFYYELGLDEIKLGNELGWNVYNDGYIKLDFSSQLTKDEEPCLVINYSILPKYDFSRF